MYRVTLFSTPQALDEVRVRRREVSVTGEAGSQQVREALADRCNNKLWQCRRCAVSVASIVVSVGERQRTARMEVKYRHIPSITTLFYT